MALISEFLDALASDDGLRETYTENPVAVMDAFGLDEAQQALVLEGDLRELRSVLEAETGPTPYIIVRLHMIIVRKNGTAKIVRKNGPKKPKPKGKK